MFRREIKLPKKLSFFLFGARSTGKSTLLSDALPQDRTVTFNLLERQVEDEFLADPKALYRRVLSLTKEIETVVIDEVQKVPRLLDTVHDLIETHKVPQRFILTGSSARKLKAGASNLLGGRAAVRHLFPLTSFEMGTQFNLEEALHFGTLPQIWTVKTQEEKADLLRAYASIYIKEEVWAEQIVRKLEPFRRFLEVAAQHSGKIINAASIAKDAQTNDKSVHNWLEVLQDTLIGFYLEPFHTSLRKQLKLSSKFYFFDVGVARALAGQLSIPVVRGTSYFGDLFEALVISELRARCHYLQNDFQLHFLRTKSDVEIDLVVKRPGKPLAFIEIKSTDHLKDAHMAALTGFVKDFPDADFMVWSCDSNEKTFGPIKAYQWQKGIQVLLGHLQ